jgi:hypothetical protein
VISGPYGTGKSAFAHFLCALCSSEKDEIKTYANDIASEIPSLRELAVQFPTRGLVRAVGTAEGEPITRTLVRALYKGAKEYWKQSPGRKPKFLHTLHDLNYQVESGHRLDTRLFLTTVREVAMASEGVIFIIDELGKALEWVAQNQDVEDLYLLQQIAELPAGERDPKVFIFGVLHQSFFDYASSLNALHRNEWAKVQGRYEDISFVEDPEQTIRLIGQAIEQSSEYAGQIDLWAQEWDRTLSTIGINRQNGKLVKSVYPLHPFSALILPILCQRYAQNDRSLFTFLTSNEPFSFQSFLDEHSVTDKPPTIKLDRLYDYFVEVVGGAASPRINVQRWVEIQHFVSEARYLDTDQQRIIKTIALLNLMTTYGPLRATKSVIPLAMCDSAGDEQREHWEDLVTDLLDKGLVTWRKQLDEIRIWEGSDFDIEQELVKQRDALDASLASLLNNYYPLHPAIAHRHSYESGTLRYFERKYCDSRDELESPRCESPDSDGLVYYWVGTKQSLGEVPRLTVDGRPALVISCDRISILREACRDLAALERVFYSSPELQTDGIARREVRYRVMHAHRILQDTFRLAFHEKGLNAQLSFLCDETYNMGPRLWNELINRRGLTSQAAMARRELIEAMILKWNTENLGLSGNGPARTMYAGLLAEPGIHRFVRGSWRFCRPTSKSSLRSLWDGIESFSMSAINEPLTVDSLYRLIKMPPYGVKDGIIPILLLAVLQVNHDKIGVYFDGSFIPRIRPEHFEILVRYPQRFAVKYYALSGSQLQLLCALQELVAGDSASSRPPRNATLLGVVKPLIKRVSKLPEYALKTKKLDDRTLRIRDVLLSTREPDVLLFRMLPVACGMGPLGDELLNDLGGIKVFRNRLCESLIKLERTYEDLLDRCRMRLYKELSVRSHPSNLREDLGVRSMYKIGKCTEPRLRAFLDVAVDGNMDSDKWLEAIVAVISDKPPAYWNDEDETNFELGLSDIARRFKNLELLMGTLETDSRSDARLITLTRPDGREDSVVVYLDEALPEIASRIVSEVLQQPELADEKVRNAVLTSLVEKYIVSTKEIPPLRIAGKDGRRG